MILLPSCFPLIPVSAVDKTDCEMVRMGDVPAYAVVPGAAGASTPQVPGRAISTGLSAKRRLLAVVYSLVRARMISSKFEYRRSNVSRSPVS